MRSRNDTPVSARTLTMKRIIAIAGFASVLVIMLLAAIVSLAQTPTGQGNTPVLPSTLSKAAFSGNVGQLPPPPSMPVSTITGSPLMPDSVILPSAVRPTLPPSYEALIGSEYAADLRDAEKMHHEGMYVPATKM